jgi:MtN3 and saliva related transmembrane protein
MDYKTIIGYCAAFGTTISFLPQAVKTIKTKDTSGISLLMYSFFTMGTALWLTYGILTNDVPVATANLITFIFACIILAYKIKYK